MNDDSRTLLLRLGQAQIDGMFARQAEGPAIDDSEFLPLVEIVLAAFEKTQGDDTLAEELFGRRVGPDDPSLRPHQQDGEI